MTDFNSVCKDIGGWNDKKILETLKNKDLSKRFQTALNEAGAIDKSMFNLIYQLCSKIKPQIIQHQSIVIKYIVEKKILSEIQVQAAFDYFMSNIDKPFDSGKFEDATGVGVVVTPEDVRKVVTDFLHQTNEMSVGKIIAEVKTKLKWADGKMAKEVVDKELTEFKNSNPDLVKKIEEAATAKKQLSKAQAKIQAKTAPAAESENVSEVDVTDFLSQSGSGVAAGITKVIKGAALTFHKPGENYRTDGYVVTPKTMDILEQHVERLKNIASENNLKYPIVITRFPPEPNGILHIGHAKAINFNFGYAKANGGLCYLRYDDTNPEKEDERFVRGIRDMVEWLGYKPYKITHASDYFEQLYLWAVELIKRGKAYVCHQKSEEIKGISPVPSPWRDRPTEESLSLFDKMRKGLFDEGEATLRMKMVMDDGKMDPIAYRIRFKAHPQTGSRWCVYPTYDFTHCLCDSIENITHSLCTKEFQNRRSAYYWVCNALDQYCPVQWEYGRMNIHYTVLSKRKIEKLIKDGIVADWDDPRLYTLSGLKRRGIPPEAIHLFVAKIGVTMAQSMLDPALLDSCCRDVLNLTAPRAMVCIDPLPVEIVNLPSSAPKTLEVPDFPADAKSSMHKIEFSSRIFIEQSDFIADPKSADKGYKRLMPNQTVGLKYVGFVLALKEIIRDENGNVKGIQAEVSDSAEKPKAFIHWVDLATSVPCEVRLYNRLFKSKFPEEVEGGFLNDINHESLVVKTNSRADQSVRNALPWSRFQFERHGYFCVDTDKSSSDLVFNRTLELKG